MLIDLCDFSEIKFHSKMLSWKKGGIAEDGIWAKYWYKNVHNLLVLVLGKVSPMK